MNKITVNKVLFGNYEGKDIYKYELISENGFQVNVLNYGGIITEIFVNDKNGKKKNVVLGYDSFEKYIKNPAYPGTIVGRTSGRIEKGRIKINEKVFELDKNNGDNHIHGGNDGLSWKIFDVKELKNGIELTYTSPHLENGYPGNVFFKIKYLLEKNENSNEFQIASEKNSEIKLESSESLKSNPKRKMDLIIEYEAVSDQDTYVNMTNHSYFNLAGELEENGDEQFLKVESDKVCKLDKNMIPTGEFMDVSLESNSIFNLKEGIKIKDGIKEGQNKENQQFEITRAYDHPFVLNRSNIDYQNNIDFEKPQIVLSSNYSKIKMEIFTTEKCAVIYTGNYLDDVLPFYSRSLKNEKNRRYLGVAIETQDYPNGINNEKFKTEKLKKNEQYYSKTVFRFGVD